MGKKYRIGFVGCGNMGSAMMKGILTAGLADRDEIIASCHTETSKARLEETYGIDVTTNNKDVVDADVVFLAVKPVKLAEVAAEIKDSIHPDTVLISVVAAKSIATLEELFTTPENAGKLQLVRTMPNTPAMVLEGMTAITPNSTITEAHLNYVCRLLESFGQTEIVPENLMDAVTGVSGSSPAFIYMLIEAMADQAVKEGMPRKQAYKFAAQAVLGSAKMVLETGEHPGVLKDAVCSPGGTTIAGVAKLEENGFRHAIMSAIEAAVAKSRG